MSESGSLSNAVISTTNALKIEEKAVVQRSGIKPEDVTLRSATLSRNSKEIG